MPRVLIIRSFRSSRYITDKLLSFCDKLSDNSINAQRQTVSDAQFVVPFEKDGRLYQFQKTAETLLCSKQPLKPIEQVAQAELPVIYPLECNISIDAEHIYQRRNVHREYCARLRLTGPILHFNHTTQHIVVIVHFHSAAVKPQSPFPHVHTAFIHYTPLNVFNVSLEPVTEQQIESRALLKAFTIAAAQAQSIYGVSRHSARTSQRTGD